MDGDRRLPLAGAVRMLMGPAFLLGVRVTEMAGSQLAYAAEHRVHGSENIRRVLFLTSLHHHIIIARTPISKPSLTCTEQHNGDDTHGGAVYDKRHRDKC